MLNKNINHLIQFEIKIIFKNKNINYIIYIINELFSYFNYIISLLNSLIIIFIIENQLIYWSFYIKIKWLVIYIIIKEFIILLKNLIMINLF